MAWPSSLSLPVIESVKIPIVNQIPPPPNPNPVLPTPEQVKEYQRQSAVKPAKTPEPPATTVDARRKQLSAMRFFALQSAAKKVFVQTKGKKPEQIVEEVLAAEFPPVAV